MEPNIGNMDAGTVHMSLGVVAGFLWFPVAVLAVAFNYRNRAAWAVLFVPPLLSCGAMLGFGAWASKQPAVVTIGPIRRAGSSREEMRPTLFMTTDKDTHAFPLDRGDQPMQRRIRTYAGRVAYKGQLDVSEDATAVSVVLKFTSEDPLKLRFQGLNNVQVRSDGEAVALNGELAPGKYHVSFNLNNPHPVAPVLDRQTENSAGGSHDRTVATENLASSSRQAADGRDQETSEFASNVQTHSNDRSQETIAPSKTEDFSAENTLVILREPAYQDELKLRGDHRQQIDQLIAQFEKDLQLRCADVTVQTLVDEYGNRLHGTLDASQQATFAELQRLITFYSPAVSALRARWLQDEYGIEQIVERA